MVASNVAMSAVPGLPLVKNGDSVSGLILSALAAQGRALAPGDVVVIAQKIVSKAEGRVVRLADVVPGEAAQEWAAKTDKDARLVELILSESRRVVRHRPGLMIVEHRLGFVMANAGIDQSNAGPTDEGEERAILLPIDPDDSARRIREEFRAATGADVGVIINDSFGRPWRAGTVGVAIGIAGLPALLDLRGEPDIFGRELAVSISGFADEIAAAASLLMGQGAERQPVVMVAGLSWSASASTAQDLVRPATEDLFR
jgi:coenzyme F420-0:L-glutamate ligase / coenzyme F420-1:gamma-L-glutamate ligase